MTLPEPESARVQGTRAGGRSRRLLFLLPVIAFALVAAYFLIALESGRDPGELPSALVGKPVPAFNLPPLIDGVPGLASADLGAGAGGPALINFFASWCIPCRAEHPLLLRLAEEEGVQVYGIAYKNEPEDARAWLAELGNPYARIGVDRDGRIGIDFGVYGVPETYVVDGDGRVRHRRVGPLDVRTLERELLPLLDDLRR